MRKLKVKGLYIRRELDKLCAESYAALRDAFTAGGGDPQSVGQRVILPSPFTGGPQDNTML